MKSSLISLREARILATKWVKSEKSCGSGTNNKAKRMITQSSLCTGTTTRLKFLKTLCRTRYKRLKILSKYVCTLNTFATSITIILLGSLLLIKWGIEISWQKLSFFPFKRGTSTISIFLSMRTKLFSISLCFYLEITAFLYMIFLNKL